MKSQQRKSLHSSTVCPLKHKGTLSSDNQRTKGQATQEYPKEEGAVEARATRELGLEAASGLAQFTARRAELVEQAFSQAFPRAREARFFLEPFWSEACSGQDYFVLHALSGEKT